MTEPITPHSGQQCGFSGYESKPEKTLEGTPCTFSSESASVMVLVDLIIEETDVFFYYYDYKKDIQCYPPFE